MVTSAPQPAKVASVNATKLVGLILGIVLLVVLWFARLPGLSTTGSHALAIAVLTAIWWIFAVLPPAIPAILASVLYFILGVAKAPDAFTGFVSPSIWMLFFALVIARGVDRSGLGRRIAALLLSRTTLSFGGIVAVFIVLSIIFPFFIPSAAGIVALNMALALGIMDALGIERDPRNKISAGLTAFIAVLTLTMGRAPLTGSVPNFIATGLVRQLTGIQISWPAWLGSMWVTIPIPAIVTYFYITRRYKPDIPLSPDELRQHVRENLERLGPMSGAEIRALILVVAAIVLWALNAYLPIDSNQVGILIGMLFLLPYIGCLDISDLKALSWDTFIFAGGSYSMGVVLTKAGFAQWAASGITALPFLRGAGFLVAGLFVIVFAFVVHLLLETLGETSLLTPIIVKSGLLPPKAVAMLIPYGAGLYVFPYQATPIVLSLGFNTTSWSDVTRYAILISIVGILQAILFLGVYWVFTMT